MADPVQSFVNEVTEHQQSLAKKRDDVAAALVEHMLRLPGMSEIFDTEEDQRIFGIQISNMIEMAARTKAAPAFVPPPPPENLLPPVEGNGGEPA